MKKTLSRSLTATFAVGALLLAGCDSDPTGTDAYPDVRGTYDTEQTATISSAGLGTFTFECEGSLTIDEQTNGNFSGTLVTAATSGCGGESLTSDFAGEIDANGNLVLGDASLDSTEEVAADAGCTIVSLDAPEGGFSAGVITASGGVTADCQTQVGEVRISIDLDFIARRV